MNSDERLQYEEELAALRDELNSALATVSEYADKLAALRDARNGLERDYERMRNWMVTAQHERQDAMDELTGARRDLTERDALREELARRPLHEILNTQRELREARALLARWLDGPDADIEPDTCAFLARGEEKP